MNWKWTFAPSQRRQLALNCHLYVYVAWFTFIVYYLYRATTCMASARSMAAGVTLSLPRLELTVIVSTCQPWITHCCVPNWTSHCEMSGQDWCLKGGHSNPWLADWSPLISTTSEQRNSKKVSRKGHKTCAKIVFKITDRKYTKS